MSEIANPINPNEKLKKVKYNGVHRNQVFHWIGRHIELKINKTKSKTIQNIHREEYISCLKRALTEGEGLWALKPKENSGELIGVTQPIVCFTEWSLGETLPHTTRYGRMGFGFPKRFVLEHGGQPITYVTDSKRHQSPYTKAIKEMGKVLNTLSNDKNYKDNKYIKQVIKNFAYISQFNKQVKKYPTRRNVQTLPIRSRRNTLVPDLYKRAYGSSLQYLEEREWRIVVPNPAPKFFVPMSQETTEPDYYLNFKAGKDLFTLVLPDNACVNLAMKCSTIRDRLFPVDAPHVTVLSLEDIGTF
jgi:hypothetical protein